MVREVQRLAHQASQMPVGQRVDHAAALLADGHQARETEFRQVLTDGGAGRAARVGERRDIRLATAERVEQHETGAVGEEAQEIGGVGKLLVARILRVRTVRR